MTDPATSPLLRDLLASQAQAADVDKLRTENARLREEVDRLRMTAAALRAQVAAFRASHRSTASDGAGRRG